MGRVALSVRLGYHLDNRRRMGMESLMMRMSWKGSGTRHPDCGNPCQESSHSTVSKLIHEGEDGKSFLLIDSISSDDFRYSSSVLDAATNV